MLSKLLLSLSLAVAPIVSVSAQAEYTEFDTFQTADKYLQDFDYLNENIYKTLFAQYNLYQKFYIDFYGTSFRFYVFPIYYDISIEDDLVFFVKYYQNEEYQFLVSQEYLASRGGLAFIENYIGNETEMPFLALDYIGMSQVIEHDKTEKSNSISIYNSFYKFFTGFFPNEVVNEYHGIFTFVIVAFLLFLVFGFVFFLFRVIRRLVGFK